VKNKILRSKQSSENTRSLLLALSPAALAQRIDDRLGAVAPDGVLLGAVVVCELVGSLVGGDVLGARDVQDAASDVEQRVLPSVAQVPVTRNKQSNG